MNYHQKLEQLMSYGHYKLNVLLDDTKKKLYHITDLYQISPNVILSGCLDGDVDNNQDQGVNNVCNLLTNHHVANMLLNARINIFKENEKFNGLISDLSKEVTGYFSGREDFTLISDFVTMRSQLESYIRNGTETKYSLNIKNQLVPLLKDYQEELERKDLVFHLLGSVRYGDAEKCSDIDANLISLSVDPIDIRERINFKDGLECTIDETLGYRNQVRDGINIIKIYDYQAILRDILDKETDCLEDYSYDNDFFHSYDWLLQGINPLNTKTILDQEISNTKGMMVEAVTVDPFFEFLLCYKMMFSIQKRQQNLERK